MTRWLLFLFAFLLAACDPGFTQPQPGRNADGFPRAERPIADVSPANIDEADRDERQEAARVAALAAIKPGMAVADIGAGRGYYMARIASMLGPNGRFYATDIMPEAVADLRARVAEVKLANVEVILGAADAPNLPPRSVDLVLMIRMYHEIGEPYEFLWRLRDALRHGARVAIFEADRETAAHGTPKALLRCELEAVGYRQIALHDLPETGNRRYLAIFEASAPRPAPQAIKACKG